MSIGSLGILAPVLILEPALGWRLVSEVWLAEHDEPEGAYFISKTDASFWIVLLSFGKT